MPGMGRYKQIRKSIGKGRANADIMPFMPSKGYGKWSKKPSAAKVTRPGGSVRPVIQGGKGATMPSLKERRERRYR
jgi:hypothetical protein